MSQTRFDWGKAGVNEKSFKYTRKDEVNPFNLRPSQRKAPDWKMDHVATENGYFIYEHSKFGFAILCPTAIEMGSNYPDWLPNLDYAKIVARTLTPIPTLRELLTKHK